MKKKMMRKSLLPTLLVFILSVIIVSVGTASPTPNSTTTVYLDPPTINGTAIGVGNTITVNINIRGAPNVYGWQAGLTFNATILNCTGFSEGEFLSDVGDTYWFPEAINNTAGVIDAHGSMLLGEITASGDGRLAYLTFKVKATGISDLHLRDVVLADWVKVDTDWEKVVIPFNIVDVYTAVVDTTHYKVVTVSNSTDQDALYDSGLYDHAFNSTLKEVSFKVTGPHPAFSNVTIPKTLLSPPELPYVWGVIIDGISMSRTVTENETHTFIYFTYSEGIHNVHITTRFMSSTISMTLSSTSITLGSDVTISGAIDPLRPGVNVTILYRLSGETDWTFLANVTTDQNGNYSYTWTPETTGTYEVKASWEGDEETLGHESDVQTLTVKGAAGIPLEIVVAAVVAIIIIAAIVVYFVKIRKSKEEE